MGRRRRRRLPLLINCAICWRTFAESPRTQALSGARVCARMRALKRTLERARTGNSLAHSLAPSLTRSLARRSERASEFISDKVWFICMLRLGEGRLLRPASEVTSCPHAQGRCVCGPRQERCDRIVLDACQGAFDAGNDARRQHHLQSVRRRPCLQLPAP